MRIKLFHDDKGFSLVELIVTVLVTSILMLGVIAFMSTSRSAYQTVNTSAVLQEESMTVEGVISELLREAKAVDFEKDVEINVGEGKQKVDVLWIWAGENEKSSVSGGTNTDAVYFFVMDKGAKKLKYCKGTTAMVNKNASDSITSAGITKIANSCFGDNGKYSLVSEHVLSMELTKSVKKPDGDLAVVKVEYEYMGKTFTDNITSVSRNMRTPLPTPSGPAGSGSPT